MGYFISRAMRAAISVSRRRRKGKTSGSNKSIFEAQGDRIDYLVMANNVLVGLEALKLGAITVNYNIEGLAKERDSIGSKGTGKRRVLATKNIKRQYSSATITAYSYRGYRKSDPSQGQGINDVMAKSLF